MGISAIRKGLIVAVLAAAVLVPAASASRPRPVKLSLLPLPKSVLGAAGHSLPIAHDSGVISNASAAGNSLTGTPQSLKKLGRLTGYLLDYGDAFRGGAGITAIQTGVDRYRSAAAAKHGLTFWKKDDATFTSFRQGGLGVTLKALKAPHVGDGRFAYLLTLTVPDVPPVSIVDEQVREGKYVLAVSVAAGASAKATALAPKLTRKLDQRLNQALAGALRAKPVKLPPPLKAGAPTGGPDLGTLALTATDFSGTATVADSGYQVDPGALSAFAIDFQPAGQFDTLSQDIEWYPSAQEATFVAGFENALIVSELAGLGVSQVTPVDLSSIGDRAQGTIGHFSSSGESFDLGVVVLARGQAVDAVFPESQTPMQVLDVANLAQAAATHLDAGVPAA